MDQVTRATGYGPFLAIRTTGRRPCLTSSALVDEDLSSTGSSLHYLFLHISLTETASRLHETAEDESVPTSRDGKSTVMLCKDVSC